MPIGRARYEPDDMDTARSELIRALHEDEGKDLERAVQEGTQYVYIKRYDDEVADALERAERRLAGSAAD